MTEPQTSPIVPLDRKYHTGIVSDDPAATMADLSRLFGYTWCDPIGGPVTVQLPEGEQVVEPLAWYSRSEPRLEVVQSIPDSVWSVVSDSDLHHFGYWVEDVPEAIAGLEAAGYLTEAAGKRPDGALYWAYLRKPGLPRVEVVSTQLRPLMESYFATGRVPARS